MSANRFNPFRPGSIVTPGMFSGRWRELQSIERSLSQTKGGNPRHFIIEGERGIGKSSLLLFAKLLASGQVSSPAAPVTSAQYLTLDIELTTALTDIDIVERLGRSLRKELVRAGHLKTVARGVLDFLAGWKILGIEYKKGKAFLDPIEAVEDFAAALKDLMDCAAQSIDGVLILIDEADKPDSSSARLGELLKHLTERLTRIGCDQVCVGLAGLPILASKLRASHPSSVRIFETLPLGPLSDEDRETVIRLGLEDASKKNPAKLG